MWLLLFLTTMFAGFSQAMTSYLIMHWSLGPWVGPVFVVVCMALAVPFVSQKWFQEHAIVTIAAGSIGGMVGLCLGMTIPSFYFLYKTEFLKWLADPIWFAGIISSLVFSAGVLAFLIAYILKNYLIVRLKLSFPMSKLIYDIISVEEYSNLHRLMWLGVGLASVWNIVLFFVRFIFQSIVMQLQIIPLLISSGFIAGHLITIPAVIGLLYHIFCVNFLHKYYFMQHSIKEFLIMFCLGMLVVQILYEVLQRIINYRFDSFFSLSFILPHLKNKKIIVLFLFALLISVLLLHGLGERLYELCFIFPLLIVIALNIAKIVGEVGIVDINGFVWCVLLPFLHSSNMSAMNLLLIATFITLFLGIVVDLVFSYKLTSLASISYRRVVKYQLLGFFVATVTSGIIMWFYAQSFSRESLYLFAQDAQALDTLINFGAFNYKIFICGALSGLLVLLAKESLLAVAGMTLMAPHVSIWLIISGLATFLVKDPKKLYPLWFGVYAAHVASMIIWALI